MASGWLGGGVIPLRSRPLLLGHGHQRLQFELLPENLGGLQELSRNDSPSSIGARWIGDSLADRLRGQICNLKAGDIQSLACQDKV